MPVWLKNPVEGGQGGSAPLRTSFSDEEKLSSELFNIKIKFLEKNFYFYIK
ncbi:hypothetical protein ATCC19606_38640 (plasmid) [Acinetobacter baumannii]|nr:hypothetical protein ATCC19606_38640 [Acinetobacter baumannii]